MTDVIFAILGMPGAVRQMAAAEGRYLRTRWRYRDTSFGKGANADDRCTFGQGVEVRQDTLLSHVRIGDFSYVGEGSVLWNCTVGRFCSIGPEVRIGLGIHPVRNVISTYPGFYSGSESVPISFHTDSSFREHQNVSIGNDVWVGARAMLLDGVSVGDGAVIAAGSIVTRDVNPYQVVAGTPAKTVRNRFNEEQTRLLLDFAWWDRGTEFCRKYAHLFGLPQQFFAMVQSELILTATREIHEADLRDIATHNDPLGSSNSI